MKKAHYITFNDLYSGIYQSQVIDVINHLQNHFNTEIKLIAYVSLRLWFSERKKIKSKFKNATVFPILGRLINWHRSPFLLNFVRNKKNAICRGPLAYKTAEKYFSNIVYDGRAAVKAEIEEYQIISDTQLAQKIIQYERQAVEKADFRIAVSNALINYWKIELNLNFNLNQTVVIPCTITSAVSTIIPDQHNQSIKIVYAGGTGPWQSFEKTVNKLQEILLRQDNTEVLFLAKENPHIDQLITKFPNRVQRKWLNHNDVNRTLQSCDYGILLREKNFTNIVASPVKFAEYLAAGLKVIISENLGDFSDFVKQNNCGYLIEETPNILPNITTSEKEININLCKQYLTKSSSVNAHNYKQILNQLN